MTGRFPDRGHGVAHVPDPTGARLGLPTTRVHASYLTAIEEYRAEGGFPDFQHLDVADDRAFAAHVHQLRSDPRTTPAPDDPKMTLLWWTRGAEYLGRLSIWHTLLGPWAESGHVGYDIRPSARGHGQATAMLRAALPIVAGLGIDPAVVCVGSGNLPSRAVVERNGGQLVEQRGNRRYYHLPTTAQNAPPHS